LKRYEPTKHVTQEQIQARRDRLRPFASEIREYYRYMVFNRNTGFESMHKS